MNGTAASRMVPGSIQMSGLMRSQSAPFLSSSLTASASAHIAPFSSGTAPDICPGLFAYPSTVFKGAKSDVLHFFGSTTAYFVLNLSRKSNDFSPQIARARAPSKKPFMIVELAIDRIGSSNSYFLIPVTFSPSRILTTLSGITPEQNSVRHRQHEVRLVLLLLVRQIAKSKRNRVIDRAARPRVFKDREGIYAQDRPCRLARLGQRYLHRPCFCRQDL